MIDPNTDKNGEDFEAYNVRRWGGSGWTRHLKQEGRKDGVYFSNWKWWPNTFKAHQLVKYAVSKGTIDTSQSHDALFHALYEEGKNISIVDELVDIGVNQFGLSGDENELRKYLQNDMGANEVKAEIQQGKTMYRISGVPFFVISKDDEDVPTYAFSGAQSEKTFLGIFKELN